MNKERHTATNRLDMLPEVFSVQELQKTQKLSAKAASVYLARWKKQDLIRHLGIRCGLWVNLKKTKDNSITLKHRIEAIGLMHPQAFVSPLYTTPGKTSENIEDLVQFSETSANDENPEFTVIVPQLSSKAGLYGITATSISNRLFQYLEQSVTPIHETPKGLVYVVSNPAVALAWVRVFHPQEQSAYEQRMGGISAELNESAEKEVAKINQITIKKD